MVGYKSTENGASLPDANNKRHLKIGLIGADGAGKTALAAAISKYFGQEGDSEHILTNDGAGPFYKGRPEYR